IMLDGAAELNESLLTGESVPVKKENGETLYAGSFVASGHCAVRVDKIGEDTYISKLTARAKKYKRPNSEIMNSINLFIKVIGFIIIPIAIFMFLTNFKNLGGSWADIRAGGGFFATLFSNNPTLNDTIQKTCSVVIGMIPSGLLLLTTVALSVGMIRLAKYNTLVQDMYSLEMLARVNVLCLDKTGTITDGRMKVSDCVLLNNATEYSVDDILGSMLASLKDDNQTSIALYERFGHSSALQASAILPFSSARKLSAVTFGEAGTFAMGAPEFVLKPMPIRVEKIVKQYAQMGLRVLVLAHSPAQIQGDKLPTVFRPIAIITLSDNIRPDAIETIKWFRENDVAVKVISGDNPVTVSEVARRAGIKNASQFLSLEGLSDIEVENAANQYTVFGRVTPEQKAILIRSIKKSGNT
ncbi:MAG: HAD-IC family P-type ATPase, partial [Christensenellaceae bacterium]